ncbi:hypothetical protein ABIA70_003477 [Arthrobacter sp. 754]
MTPSDNVLQLHTSTYIFVIGPVGPYTLGTRNRECETLPGLLPAAGSLSS